MIKPDNVMPAEGLQRALERAAELGVDPAHFTQLLYALVEHLRVGVYAKDADGRYIFANQSLLGAMGRPLNEVVGRQDEQLLPQPLASQMKAGDHAARQQKQLLQREEKLPLPGDQATLRDFVSLRFPLPRQDGGAMDLCGIWMDLTELRRLQGQLRHALTQLEQQQRQNDELRNELQDQAIRDPLTSVYNGRHFEEHLRREIDLSMREHREFALVSIQVDRFAEMVSGHGAVGGERTLQALGRLLRSNTRAMDAPCRLGDERFVVVLSGVGLATAHARMESVRRQCEAQIVMLEGQQLRFTVSMGVASFPHTSEDLDTLIGAADGALKQAPARGGNCVMLATIPFEPQQAA